CYTNILIGNRIGFDRPLLSTPKSVTDRYGRGSFRSHADTQVLATRWDYLPEENGFPANRQFYLIENGKVIFYSADVNKENVVSAFCTFSQNNTKITYTLSCGLSVTRTIFILPQYEGLPIANEAQIIEITNQGSSDRDIRIVYTGMFGTNASAALTTDVIYSNVICESNVIRSDKDEISAVSYHYNPKWEQGNIRYNVFMAFEGEKVVYPDQFGFKYSDFVGSGSLENPLGAARLNNRHVRRGPGFFAVSAPVTVKAGASVTAQNFTGLVSDIVNKSYDATTLYTEITALIEKYNTPDEIKKSLHDVTGFASKYSSFITVENADKHFENYVNHNLPYQVYYQTFVSRSFDQTQKGYREVGFREIQDIFTSMYYFASMGKTDFIKQLLREWISNVYEMGYANHDFYWKGKCPGLCSDDQLWLFQALDRYVSLTGDYAFLTEECATADGGQRKIYDTLKAIIVYSGKISVGGHGLTLIDRADWNDCLSVDPDKLSGPDKEELYRKQLEKGGTYGDRLETEQSESVMNAFLLKVSMDAMKGMAVALGDDAYLPELNQMAQELSDNLQKTCWKENFFTRVMFNRKDKPELSYLGAKGDNVSLEEGADGTYFLNSFAWSVHAGVATEEQIGIMLDTITKNLKTPYGFRLCSSVDFSKIAPTVDVSLYFDGDRENGGVFKHANMMAASAMLKAANQVKDKELAAKLAETAWWTIDVVLPYKTLEHPFDTCGNPRFCTQYNNSDNGENYPPTLSGTSTWLLLTLMSAFGLSFTKENIEINPLLRTGDTAQKLTVNDGVASYEITITKPEGFYRTKEGCKVTIDGVSATSPIIPKYSDGKTHQIQISL
ncbi:MAG: glycosyl transferase, partial [Clostridiales bacterium 43-6]